MISKAIKFFIDEDHLLAIDVIHTDDEVDDLYDHVYQELLEMLAEKSVLAEPKYKNQVIRLLLIGRYFERIADHTTNVAESVVYMVTGKVYK